MSEARLPGPPGSVVHGVNLLANNKAQCLCGAVISQSSIYRHAIGGDGHCSGGHSLSVEQIAYMKQITFEAKASYMRTYRERSSTGRRRRFSSTSGGTAAPVVDGPAPSAGHGAMPVGPVATLAAVASAAAAEAPGAATNVAMTATAPAATTEIRPHVSAILQRDPTSFAAAGSAGVIILPSPTDSGEDRAVCPGAGCGKTVWSRNLVDHVSSKSCKGGYSLTITQLSAIKSIAKNARLRNSIGRKYGIGGRGGARANGAGMETGLVDAGGSAGGPLSVSGFQGGTRRKNTGFAVGARRTEMAATPQAVVRPSVDSASPVGVAHTGMASATPQGASGGDSSSVRDALMNMSIPDIGALIAHVVGRGHGEAERKTLEEEIVAGVEAYRLTALVLMARRPDAETLAKRILAKRSGGQEEDGVYWAVVEFVERSRGGDLGQILTGLPL